MERMGNPQEHIVMIPFLAQGHIIPFLELAKKLQETTNFTITLVSTPLNIQKLKATQSSTCKIHLVSLPFNPSDHDLPPNAETTEALPLYQIGALCHASTALETPFQQLISTLTFEQGKPPLCIISDVFMGWTNRVAKLLDIINVSLSTCGAYGTAAFHSVWQSLPQRYVKSDDEEFVLPGFPETCKITRAHLHKHVRNADGSDRGSKFFQPQLSLCLGSFGWLCNTVEEIEPLGVQVLKNYTKLPVWCIGPLLPPRMLDSSSCSNEIFDKRAGIEPGLSPETCVQWLDSYPENSVLYISFGSQNTISPAQMMELAKGIEESGKPFIWTVRPPIGFDLNEKFRDEWLPHKFEERMSASKRGLLIHKWAPQLDILCHKSTGAFLSHCGWNSTMESLSQGVPLIGWPLAGEQVYNSKMIEEEMGVGVELARGLESCITKNDVKRVIEIVMENEGIRRKAGEISEMIKQGARQNNGKKGSSLQALDDFVSALLAYSRT
nr:PREDICTED: crocetin glucosyltransferase 3-like [Daucus carota subsp. sativus]